MTNKIKIITIIAIYSGVISIISPITIPIGIIPFTLSTFTIYLIGGLTKKYIGVFATIIYIFIGIIGLPVFSNYTGGIGVVLSITGGYILGYIPCVFVISLITSINKKNIFLYPISMILGTLICYMIGTFWFMGQTKNSFLETVLITIVPFIIFDIIKVILATICCYILNNKTPYKEMINYM